MIDHPAWVEEDDVYTSPLCNAKCGSDSGTAGPRGGSQWAWFGGLPGTEQNQNLRQDIVFPSEPVAAALSFYVRVGEFDNESSVLRAKLDGVTLFTLDALNQADYAGGYTRVVIPLEDPVMGGPYELLFEYESGASAGEDRTNISVDDVTVETTYLRDGDFEAAVLVPDTPFSYFDSPGWTEAASEGFESPICEVTACGVGLDTREPHGGGNWAYFGFSLISSISQVATTPALADAAVSFFVVGDEFENPGAKVTLKVDGAVRFTLDQSNDQLFGDRYRVVKVPLGSLAAGSHTLGFDFVLPNGGPASANIDDVALTGTLTPPPGPAPGPSVAPIAAPASPQTRIAKLKLLPKSGAKLRFAGSGGSGKLRFQCKLDKGKFRTCTSPKTYSGLKVGKHTFQVRAVDATGATDATPAKRSFQIAAPQPRSAR